MYKVQFSGNNKVFGFQALSGPRETARKRSRGRSDRDESRGAAAAPSHCRRAHGTVRRSGPEAGAGRLRYPLRPRARQATGAPRVICFKFNFDNLAYF